MRSSILAFVIAMLLAAPAHADEINFGSKKLSVPDGSQLSIGLSNSCDSPAGYRLRVRSGTGGMLLSRNGEIKARGKASFVMTHGHAVTGVVISVRLKCATGTPEPRLNYVVEKIKKSASTTLGDLRAPLVPRG